MNRGLFLPAALLLLIITRINGEFWPPVWPDEALFSSPAAELAATGTFATPVLSGLIPGMERATLWNGPLYMVLLSGVYRFTGENLDPARGLSLVIALATLFVFIRTISLFVTDRKLLFLLPIVLVFDPTFSRAASTVRMDILTLFFLVATHYFLFLDALDPAPRKRNRRYFFAGFLTGCAGMSHPIAIILIPVILIYGFPRIRLIAIAAAGALLSFSAWIVYILSNLKLFQIQFLSQLMRKSTLFRLWGGETGGIFTVFSSQYGGGALFMAAALLLFAGVIAAGWIALFRIRTGWKTEPFLRLHLSFCVITLLVMAASEGWYALYPGPFLLFVAAYLIDPFPIDCRLKYRINPPWFVPLPWRIAALFLIASTLQITIRNRLIHDIPQRLRTFQTETLRLGQSCHSIYLRMIPDPYFLFRTHRPDIAVYEFIPGKLRIPENEENVLKKYGTIECFLINSEDVWEPLLTGYLARNSGQFDLIRYPSPLAAGSESRLFRRKSGKIDR